MAVYKKDNIIHIYFRYKDIQGKMHTIHRQSKKWKSKKEAKLVEDVLKLELTRNYDDLTYNQLFSLYIEERNGKIKKKSIYNLTKLNDKHLVPYFGTKKMSEITPTTIKKWQTYLLSLDYSNRYTFKIQELLRTVINFGLKFEYITYNPFKISIAQNKNEFKKEMLFWEQHEYEQFISVVDNETYHALFSLLYWTGLRIGEAQALQVKDIDLIKNELHVSKTYNAIHHELTTPKTNNSYRTVRLTESLVATLKTLIDKYSTTYKYSSEAFVFGYDKPMPPNTIRKRFNNYIEKAEVKKIPIHSLRHSHVSLLRQLGFDRYEVAKRLGHTPEMVDNTYTHWFESSQQEMVDKLNKFEKSREFATKMQREEIKH